MREGLSLFLLAAAVYLLAALATFNPADPGWSHTGESASVANAGGSAGAFFADLMLSLLGYVAYTLPPVAGYLGWLLFREQRNPSKVKTDQPIQWMRGIGIFAMLITACGLAGMHIYVAQGALPAGAAGGGIIGDLINTGLIRSLSLLGTTLLLVVIFLAAFTFTTGLSWIQLMEWIGSRVMYAIEWAVQEVHFQYSRLVYNAKTFLNSHVDKKEKAKKTAAREAREKARQEKADARAAAKANKTANVPVAMPVEVEDHEPAVGMPPLDDDEDDAPGPRIVEPPPQREQYKRKRRESQINLFDVPPCGGIPPLSLLDEPVPQEGSYSKEELEAMSQLLKIKFSDFKVSLDVVAVHPGPVITRFELQPDAGVKSSQIANLSKDIARSLSVLSVRVVEVIPGKTTVGIEIPNERREMVMLSEVLQSSLYDDSASPLTLALGKDISGRPVVADIAKMPHLLVAGTTGSGKSVAVNSMLISLLYKATPKDVRLILIDPKMLELNVYEGIPHLLAPVVTDMKEAANALRWCVAEMERRYRLMASLGVRNIGGFNRKVSDAIKAGEPLKDPLYKPEEAFDPEAPHPTLDTLPYIVVVVDEFADMMMVVGKKVEELIARIAQKARAAGIHLVLATQRPSVDVITGLIKANIPTRMAFQVSSKVDSRTILDQMGAEQLLGHGDMLYLPPGKAAPERVHGAFVDDHEVHNVVASLKEGGEAQYNEDILRDAIPVPGLPGEPGDDSEQDALYDQAVAVVTESRKASISYVQRRLKIGYNRAARMIEDMEAAGVVSPVSASGQREVLAPPPVES